jgi:hypothetical protein
MTPAQTVADDFDPALINVFWRNGVDATAYDYERRYLKLAYKTLLDRAVLQALEANSTPFGLRAGQIAKLLLGKKLREPDFRIPSLQRLASHVANSLKRLEREGRVISGGGKGHDGGKRWWIK